MPIMTSAISRLFSFPVSLLPRAAAAALLLALAACGGGGGSGSSTAAVSISISSSPTAATAGQVVSLTWNASNATGTCTASGDWSGSKTTSGTESVIVSDVRTYTFGLSCNGVSSNTSVVVTPVTSTAPAVSMAFAPASIEATQSSVLTWSAQNATSCTASGAWSGNKATSGTATVTQTSTGTYAYTLTCTGSGGSATGSASLAVTSSDSINTASLLVDNGPTGATGVINQPYVNVTICTPGTTTCQTIDHVLVDTGSYGLRLNVDLDSGLALPAVTTPSGAAAGECAQFVSGYVWGAVVKADVTIGGETASNLPIQIGGTQSSPFITVPTACSSTGNSLASVSALGANGILGIGLFKQDCGADCVSTATPMYYGCTSAGCTQSKMPLTSQVSNPVSSFSVNNNGVALVFPSVSTSGATSLTGTLIFGVNTQTNNTLATETAYKASSDGNYTVVYNGVTYGASFIDSGSNGIYFDSSLPACSVNTDFYCPTSALTLSLTTSSYDASNSGTTTVQLVNIDNLSKSINAAYIGGSMSSLSTGSSSASYDDSFDLGLPFFFGRKVYVVIEGNTVTQGTGPFWAY
jgi:plastocyanin